MEGFIFNIQKFCLHDGPGIRTTVFFKGCNLRCKWCANPESQQMRQQLTLDKRKCTGCGKCVAACPQGARSVDRGVCRVDAALCNGCRACLQVCPSRAIGSEGRTVSVEEVLEEALKDKVFYDTSGGGVTFSGGEVLLQRDFATALARRLRENGVHVAVETAAAVPLEAFSAFLQEVDYVLMDLKHYDSDAHKTGTGVDNRQILENLRYLKDSGKPFLVRIPVIPGFNDSLADAQAFGKLLKELEIPEVQLLPFHQLGRHKYDLLNMQYAYAGTPQLHTEDLEAYRRQLVCQGIEVRD